MIATTTFEFSFVYVQEMNETIPLYHRGNTDNQQS